MRVFKHIILYILFQTVYENVGHIRLPISQMTILPPFYKTESGHLQQIHATAWKITQDFIHVHVRYWMKKVNTQVI